MRVQTCHLARLLAVDGSGRGVEPDGEGRARKGLALAHMDSRVPDGGMGWFYGEVELAQIHMDSRVPDGTREPGARSDEATGTVWLVPDGKHARVSE